MLTQERPQSSAQASTVEDTAAKLKDSPCANIVRNHLKEGLLTWTEIKILQEEINELLVAQLPPRIITYRHRIAIDLVFTPYYGEPAQDRKEIRRSKAREGTTRFHCYGTVYVIKRNKRVTLAFTYARQTTPFLGF